MIKQVLACGFMISGSIMTVSSSPSQLERSSKLEIYQYNVFVSDLGEYFKKLMNKESYKFNLWTTACSSSSVIPR
jgi:hypothetical protein